MIPCRELTLLAGATTAGHELVTGPMYGQEETWVAWVRFKLLSKPEDMIVHRAGRGIILISPDFIQ